MRVRFGARNDGHRRRWIESFERELRRARRRDSRRHDCRQRADAADTGFEADRAVTVVRSGRRPLGAVAVANNPISAVERFNRGLGGAKARGQARQRNRIGGNKRDYALPQWAPGESVTHGRSPTAHRPQTA